MADEKRILLTVRMYTEDDLFDYNAACYLRGGSMSDITRQFAKKVIFEEKQKHSEEEFQRAREIIIKEKQSKKIKSSERKSDEPTARKLIVRRLQKEQGRGKGKKNAS